VNRLILILAIGCGSDGTVEPMGSGVDGTLTVGTLAAPDIDGVCAYGVGLSRVVVCNDREVDSVTSEAACLDLLESFADTCDATVAELETCFEDLAAQSDAEVCGLATPESCAFFGDPDCLDL
jgi:hypothetical protein